MIRIVKNDNILLLSASDVIRQNAARQTAAVGSTVDVITSNHNTTSNIMWQSVPRSKSMVHSVQANSNSVSRKTPTTYSN